MKRIRTHDDNGQTMVEFALVLPILLVLLFGIIQFGITFKDYVTLTDAVRSRRAQQQFRATRPTPSRTRSHA
jgi:Flp pilus assembly protein TadG